MHGWRDENSTCGAVQSELGLECENCFILFFFQLKTQQREAVEQFPWWCFVGQKPFRKSGRGFFLKTKCFVFFTWFVFSGFS